MTLSTTARLIALTHALIAVQARVSGDWDNPALQQFGPLTTSTLDDVKHIVTVALGDDVAIEEWAAV